MQIFQSTKDWQQGIDHKKLIVKIRSISPSIRSGLLTAIAILGLSFASTAQIVRIENDQAVTDTNKFSGSVNLNIYTIKNNSQFFKLATGSQFKYSKNKNTVLSINELRLIFASQSNLENRGFQHLRYQRTLDSNFTWEAFSQIQFDQVLKIKLRQLNGTGPRMQLFRKSKSKLFLGLHYMYEYEEEYETDIINSDHRFSTHFAFSKKFASPTLNHSSIIIISALIQLKIEKLSLINIPDEYVLTGK